MTVGCVSAQKSGKSNAPCMHWKLGFFGIIGRCAPNSFNSLQRALVPSEIRPWALPGWLSPAPSSRLSGSWPPAAGCSWAPPRVGRRQPPPGLPTWAALPQNRCRGSASEAREQWKENAVCSQRLRTVLTSRRPDASDRAVNAREEGRGRFLPECVLGRAPPKHRHLAGRTQNRRPRHFESGPPHLISQNIPKWFATSVFSLLKALLNWVSFSIFLTAWTCVKLLFCLKKKKKEKGDKICFVLAAFRLSMSGDCGARSRLLSFKVLIQRCWNYWFGGARWSPGTKELEAPLLWSCAWLGCLLQPSAICTASRRGCASHASWSRKAAASSPESKVRNLIV